MKKEIKRYLVFMLIFSMVLTLSACGGKGEGDQEEKDLLARIKERGTITIATEGNWVPWTYHDENDELVGYDVELGKLIAEQLGVTADFQETDWDSILAGVDSGRFDIACNGVGYTEERAEKYSFSTPYAYTTSVLVVREDNNDIKELEDLKGRTTANSPSSTYAMMAEEQGATVTYVSTLNETITLLEQGRVDATINSQGSIQDYLNEHPDAKVKIVKLLAGETVVIPVRKAEDTESLVAAINAALDTLRENGKLSELSVKYFGGDVTKSSN